MILWVVWCANMSTLLSSAFCSSELYTVFMRSVKSRDAVSKVEKTVNRRCMALQLWMRSKAVGRGREDDVEPSDSRRSAQPEAQFVKSLKHWLMFRFLVKKLLILLYQMSNGAATPRHLLHSTNIYQQVLHDFVFVWHVSNDLLESQS